MLRLLFAKAAAELYYFKLLYFKIFRKTYKKNNKRMINITARRRLLQCQTNIRRLYKMFTQTKPIMYVSRRCSSSEYSEAQRTRSIVHAGTRILPFQVLRRTDDVCPPVFAYHLRFNHAG